MKAENRKTTTWRKKHSLLLLIQHSTLLLTTLFLGKYTYTYRNQFKLKFFLIEILLKSYYIYYHKWQQYISTIKERELEQLQKWARLHFRLDKGNFSRNYYKEPPEIYMKTYIVLLIIKLLNVLVKVIKILIQP